MNSVRPKTGSEATRPGNAAFVPPPPEKMTQCLDALEKFLHRQEDLPVLVKTALQHVQFETIHPFLDGNGRLGWLLSTFLLCVAGAIREPILYFTSAFISRRTVRSTTNCLTASAPTEIRETWLELFQTGVKETAQQAADTSKGDTLDHRKRPPQDRGAWPPRCIGFARSPAPSAQTDHHHPGDRRATLPLCAQTLHIQCADKRFASASKSTGLRAQCFAYSVRRKRLQTV